MSWGNCEHRLFLFWTGKLSKQLNNKKCHCQKHKQNNNFTSEASVKLMHADESITQPNWLKHLNISNKNDLSTYCFHRRNNVFPTRRAQSIGWQSYPVEVIILQQFLQKQYKETYFSIIGCQPVKKQRKKIKNLKKVDYFKFLLLRPWKLISWKPQLC